MSHHLFEVQHGDRDKRQASVRYKPDPVFVAATIAKHKAVLRDRLAKSLRFAKGRELFSFNLSSAKAVLSDQP